MNIASEPLVNINPLNASPIVDQELSLVPQPTIPPFYFIVVFWGEKHRNYFLDLLLASLLSPKNIPALHHPQDCRFVICTTADDWNAIQDTPIFRLLKTYVQPLFVEMTYPGPDELKMLVMSKGHKAASQIAFEARANGVFLTPDLILSDGSVAAMQRLAHEGKKVVLCVAIRFEHYGCMDAFKKLGVLKEGEPLTISARQLMKVALNNLHSETVRYIWDTSYFAECPITCLWKVGNKGYVAHSYSWAPLVVNYASITDHNTETFEKWTLDGDYIYANFGEDGDVHVVTDSDEIALVSFTKEEELHIPKHKSLLNCLPVYGDALKITRLRQLHYSHVMDPLKRRILPIPVFLKIKDGKRRWGRVAARAAKYVRQAIAEPTETEQFVAYAVSLRTHGYHNVPPHPGLSYVLVRSAYRVLKTARANYRETRAICKYIVSGNKKELREKGKEYLIRQVEAVPGVRHSKQFIVWLCAVSIIATELLRAGKKDELSFLIKKRSQKIYDSTLGSEFAQALPGYAPTRWTLLCLFLITTITGKLIIKGNYRELSTRITRRSLLITKTIFGLNLKKTAPIVEHKVSNNDPIELAEPLENQTSR